MLAAFVLGGPPAMAQGDPQDGTFEVNCPRGLSFNARTEETLCLGVNITDGTSVISADEASTRDSDTDDGVWQLVGNVRITFETTEIRAQSASFVFADGDLVRGELRGDPVVMSDYIAERETTVSATSELIELDKREGTLRLAGESTLVQGGNELKGCNLAYGLNDHSFSFGTTDTCGAVMRVAPAEDSGNRSGQAGAP